jgi:hypothetical protein
VRSVESYTLCIFFILASFHGYLDLVSVDPPRRSRIAFAAFSSLAILSHYLAGLYLAACVIGLVAVALIRRASGQAAGTAPFRRWTADLLTMLPAASIGAAFYLSLVKPWLVWNRITFSLLYFRPGEEKIWNFWIRGLRDTFNLFAPVALPRARYALPLLAIFLTAVIWAPATDRRLSARSEARIMPALFLCVLLALGMGLGALGRYPFGGHVRHQFLLFLFALLAGFVAVDRLVRAVPRRARAVLIAAGVGVIALNSVLQRQRIFTPDYRTQPLVAKKGIFERSLSGLRTVHIDQFNLIGMVMDYYGWNWRFAGPDPSGPWIERYELTRDGQRLTLFAHRSIWLMDFRSAALYEELEASLRQRSDGCETAFCVYRNVYGPPWTKLPGRIRDSLQAQILRLAARAGLEIRGIVLTDDAARMDFCKQQ